MEMVGALWVTMAGTVCASWAGGAPAVTPPWRRPAVMSRTMTEVTTKKNKGKSNGQYTHGQNVSVRHARDRTRQARLLSRETSTLTLLFLDQRAVYLEKMLLEKKDVYIK